MMRYINSHYIALHYSTSPFVFRQDSPIVIAFRYQSSTQTAKSLIRTATALLVLVTKVRSIYFYD